MKRDDFAVIALIEEPFLHSIARKKFQRAQNRSLSMPIFRGDEDAAMRFIAREMKLAAYAAFSSARFSISADQVAHDAVQVEVLGRIDRGDAQLLQHVDVILPG